MSNQNKTKYERVLISSLKPMPKNTRKHSARNIAVIAESMRRWGQQKDIIVDENNVVLAGNGTIEAAKKLGWTDIDIKRSDLKGSDSKAYSITDNRSAELAEYDNDNLKEELAELEAEEWDLDGLGWNGDDIKALNNDPFLVDDKDDSEKDRKYIVTISFENESEMEDLFIELRDRGLKVKAS